MITNTKKLQEVQSVITSLLAVQRRGNGIDMIEFDRMYKDAEGERVPFRSFGYSSLAEFLRTIPEVDIRLRYGKDTIYFAGKESTIHVTRLVDRQRPNKAKCNRSRSYCRPVLSHYMGPPRKVSPSGHYDEISDEILDIIQQRPRGLSRNTLLRIYSDRHPRSNFDNTKLSHHLKSLETKLIVRDNMVIPLRNLRSIRMSTPRSNSVPPQCAYIANECRNNNNVEEVGTAASNYRVSLDSDGEYIGDFDDGSFDFVTPTENVVDEYSGYTAVGTKSKTTTSNSTGELETQNHEDYVDKENSVDKFILESQTQMQEGQTKLDEDDSNFSRSQDYMASVLCERVQFRLAKLIQNIPDGIWCIDLPKKYREEYKIPLEWENLGFQRISNFAAHLPHIFHMVGPFENSDFRLYDATAPLPSDTVGNNKKQKQTAASLYRVYDSDDDEVEAVPTNIPLELSNQISPDDVMANGESVGQISVTTFKVFGEASSEELPKKVRVVEAFSPSFFWIQIEKKIRKFEEMMNNLHTFYEAHKAKYIVPTIMLEKGLNVAVLFFGRWHRGIIKAVDPDCQVTVLFYDYGTVKSYSWDHIFHLHRNFSALPAQAIPCGLYNVKPLVDERWPKNVIDSFIKRVHDRPLWAVIGHIDIETNSMLISLTDTSEQKDFHVSDWMFKKKMAIAGHMVRIRMKNFVYQHYLQSKIGLRHENNIINFNNVNNNTRLSSFENSVSPDTRLRQQIGNVTGECCPKCGYIPGNTVIEDEKTNANKTKKDILRNMLRNFQNKLSNGSSSVQSSLRVNNVVENAQKLNQIAYDMKNIMDDDIIIDGEQVRKSVNLDGKESPTLQPRYGTSISLVDDIPEMIPEFGTIASPLGGHGRMEPIDWSVIRAKVLGNIGENESLLRLSPSENGKPWQSPLLMDIKKVTPKLKPINKRFDKFLDVYHSKLHRNSSIILKRESQVVKSSVITPMVRRTLNDINKSFNNHVRVTIPEEIKTLLNDSSTAVSSENEIDGWNSPGDERSYLARKLGVEQSTEDSSASNDQRTKKPTEKSSENCYLNGIVDPKDLSNYTEDYGDVLEVLNQSEVSQSQSAELENVLKLPPGISNVAVEKFCSGLSLLEKKQSVIMTTIDSINNLQNVIQKIILGYFGTILAMHATIDSVELMNKSEALAKTIIDEFHSALTIVETDHACDATETIPLSDEKLTCMDVNIGVVKEANIESNTQRKNEKDVTARSKLEMSIANACRDFWQRQQSTIISDNSNIDRKSNPFLNSLKDTNPFKEDILLNLNSAASSKTPPPLPPRLNENMKYNSVQSPCNFIPRESVKIVYQASPVLYNSLKKSITFGSTFETKLESPDLSFPNTLTKCIEEWKRVDLSTDEDDKGYQSDGTSTMPYCSASQQSERIIRVNDEESHVDSRINDKNSTINDYRSTVGPTMEKNFKLVQLARHIACIFNINGEGWISVSQFRSTFTPFGNDDGLYQYIDSIMPKMSILILKRTENSALFDRYEREISNWQRSYKSTGKRHELKKTDLLALITLLSMMKLMYRMGFIKKEEIIIQLGTKRLPNHQPSQAMTDVIKLISTYGNTFGSYHKKQS